MPIPGVDIHPGSSPRIRGEFHISQNSGGAGGIIPANTGRIRGGTLRQSRDRDHPREYGENSSALR